MVVSSKNTGWLEILGYENMVNIRVLKAAGIDSDKYQGFAFGLGVERIYMLRNNKNCWFKIFFDNDLRFLDQYNWRVYVNFFKLVKKYIDLDSISVSRTYENALTMIGQRSRKDRKTRWEI